MTGQCCVECRKRHAVVDCHMQCALVFKCLIVTAQREERSVSRSLSIMTMGL